MEMNTIIGIVVAVVIMLVGLKKAYKSGSINKENINKRGYNKFLEISENVKVTIQ